MFDRSPSATSAPGSTAASLPTGALSPVKRRFLRLERRRMNDPTVGGNDVARLHLHDVTGNHIGGRHQRERAVTHHLRLRNLQVRQRSHTRPRFQLLPRTEHDVEEDQQRHDDPRRNLADREAHHHDRNQHDVHRLRNWPNATAHTDGGFSLVISFGPNCSSRCAALPGAQPRSRIRPQRRRHVGGLAGERRRRRRASVRSATPRPASTVDTRTSTPATYGPRRIL